MKIFRTVAEMRAWGNARKAQQQSIGFVPTMGALHDGHLALVRRARAETDAVVVSIFVNPLQFGPREDFKRYPRPVAHDLALLRRARVDAVWMPGASDLYPEGFSTRVSVGGLSTVLEGAHRPGHFDGVATVVAKLLAGVWPARAYFGLKDYQQVRVIDRMVRDLNLPVKIVACPTVREADGLAMSSRNRYLSKREREEAVKLYQALYLGRELISQRIMTDAKRVVKRLCGVLKTIPKSRIDYVTVADPVTLAPMTRIKRPALIAMAVRIGTTRLIDNVLVD